MLPTQVIDTSTDSREILKHARLAARSHAAKGDQLPAGRLRNRPLNHRLLGDGRTTALLRDDGEIDWWCAPRPHGDLDETVAIAEIDENDPPEVAAAMYPASQADLLPDVLFSQRAAAVGSQGCLSHAGVYAPPLSASHRMR